MHSFPFFGGNAVINQNISLNSLNYLYTIHLHDIILFVIYFM